MKNFLLSTSGLLCLCALLMSWTPAGLNGKETAPDPGNSQIVPLDQTFWIPCANGGAGEYVRFTGTLQVVSFVKTDANGGRHLHVHEQPQNVTGLGLTTGAEFRGTGMGGFTLNIKADNTGNYTAVNNFY